MARQFTDVIGDLAGGEIASELTAALADVVAAVNETRKVGSLTLSIKVRPNSDSTVMVTTDIKAKAPEPPRGDTLFFTTTDGSLRRDDPKQRDLPLREVAEPDGEAKEVKNG